MPSKDEIKKIVTDSLNEFIENKGPVRKILFMEMLKTFLTPFVITVVSLVITYLINLNQSENAKEIANAQIQSAGKIAEAQMKHSISVARSEIEVQRIEQIRSIYNEIIKEKKAEEKNMNLMPAIESLTVYKETALPFLVRIRDHFKKMNTGASATEDLVKCAQNTIKKILEGEQLDFKGMDFSAAPGTVRNLRFANFENYNLHKAKFNNCNLYSANLKNSTLIDAEFVKCDLYNTDFSNANLTGVNFDKANVRKTVFLESKLDGVKNFESTENLEDAILSLSALSKDYEDVKMDPFANVKNTVRLDILAKNHLKELEEKGKDHRLVKSLIKKLETVKKYDNKSELQEEEKGDRVITSYEELISYLKERENLLKK